MAKINDGGPAFPHCFEDCAGHPRYLQSQGLSLRDYFAGQALSAMGASWFGEKCSELAAAKAYHVADAMLAAREADPS